MTRDECEKGKQIGGGGGGRAAMTYLLEVFDSIQRDVPTVRSCSQEPGALRGQFQRRNNASAKKKMESRKGPNEEAHSRMK